MKTRTCRPRVALASLILFALFVVPVSADIQTDSEIASDDPGSEQRLAAFTGRLQLAFSLASIAAYSPTVADVRSHAQQLVNLLEGSEGRHTVSPQPPFDQYSGLLAEAAHLAAFFDDHIRSPDVRRAVHASMERVRTYLETTLDAALLALDQRRLVRAVDLMRGARAYLSTALLGNPETPEWIGVLRLPEILGRDAS